MDLDLAIETIGFGFFQIKAITVFFTLQIADGCEVLLLAFLGNLLNCEWRIGTIKMASLTASVFVGMFFGAIVLGNMSDRYGRRSVMFLACFIILYSSFHTAFAPTYEWVCFLRGWVGFGIAGVLVINSASIAEISPRSYRPFGQAVVFTGWSVGSVLIVGIGALTVPTLGWRGFILVATVPVCIGCFGLLYIDESPRYLLMSGDKDAAFEVIKKMAKLNRKELPCKELNNVSSGMNERASIASLFKSEFSRAVFLMTFMSFTAGFSYYGAVFLSAQLPLLQYDCTEGHSSRPQSELYDDSCCTGLRKDAYVSMAIAASGDLFAGIVMTALISFFGRKNGMMICLMVSALLFVGPIYCMPKRVRDVLLLSLRCFTLIFSQIVVLYASEIFPTTIRSTAIGFCALMKRIGGMLTSFVGQVAVVHYTKEALLLYAVVCIFALATLFLCGEETRDYQLFDNVNQFSDRPLLSSQKKSHGSRTGDETKD